MDIFEEESEEQSLEEFKQQNKAIVKAGNIDDTVVAICHKHKYELMKCVNCPIVKECNYTRKRIDKLRDDAKRISKEIYDTEVELDNSAENQIFAEKKSAAAYEDYLRRHSHEELKNERCIYERKEVLYVLQKFVDADYDITDPRAFLIINELIGSVLNTGRINKVFTQYGVMLSKETAQGTLMYANPLLKSKSEYSRLIVDTVEALDRILKSDEQQKADKEFTEYLLQSLKVKVKKKEKVLDAFDIEVPGEDDGDD